MAYFPLCGNIVNVTFISVSLVSTYFLFINFLKILALDCMLCIFSIINQDYVSSEINISRFFLLESNIEIYQYYLKQEIFINRAWDCLNSVLEDRALYCRMVLIQYLYFYVFPLKELNGPYCWLYVRLFRPYRFEIDILCKILIHFWKTV